MNIKSLDDYTWNYRDCYLCKIPTPQKEMRTVILDYEGHGSKGTHGVQACKECYRESQLNKLI
jgi:hypothetical protein